MVLTQEEIDGCRFGARSLLIKRQGFHTVLREGWSEQMGQKGGREGCWWWGVGKCKLTIYIHVVVRSGALVALITLYMKYVLLCAHYRFRVLLP